MAEKPLSFAGTTDGSLLISCRVCPQVDVGLKQLSCHFMGGGIGEQHGLEAFAEAKALQLKACKPVRVKRNRRQQKKQNTEAQALYIIEFNTGTLQVSNVLAVVICSSWAMHSPFSHIKMRQL